MTALIPRVPPAGKPRNAAERALLKAAATGKLVDLRTGDAGLDDPANAANWSVGRNVRADFLADLLTGDRPTATGRLRAVKLQGARITGGLDLVARKVLCPLLLRDCVLDEKAELIHAEVVSIRLPGCRVPAGLNAQQLRSTGSVEFSDGFAAPFVGLLGAHIGGQLILRGAKLTGGGPGPVLAAYILTVDQDMFCWDGFTTVGKIDLEAAHIGGQLNFNGANLNGGNGPALTAEGLTVDQGMLCGEGFTVRGEVNLTNAKIGVLYDDQASWPSVVHLGGFVYGRLGNSDVDVRARLQWLRRHPGRFTPGIYDQLADVYRRAGDEEAARKVAIAKQSRRRGSYNPLGWLWYITVGYGYRTWQAFIWAAALIVVGSLVFSGAYPAHMVALTARPPKFQAVIYTLDVLLPIGALGQKSAWQPTTSGLLGWYWALSIAGWVLSAAVLAGLSGILKRD